MVYVGFATRGLVEPVWRLARPRGKGQRDKKKTRPLGPSLRFRVVHRNADNRHQSVAPSLSRITTLGFNGRLIFPLLHT